MPSEYIDAPTGEVVQLGLVEMTNDEYHAALGVSKSHLDFVADNGLRKYWFKYRAPLDQRIVQKQTPAKILGNAIHCAVLQPDLLRSLYIADPGIDKRSNAGKAEWAGFCAEHAAKTILKDEDFQTVLAVRDAVQRHPVARGLLAGCRFEQPVFAIDPETGELVKCQVDALHEGGNHIVDVKSTDDASPNGFGKSAFNYRYDWQPPFYQDVLDAAFGEHPPHWVFMAVEKEPPYEIGLYFIDPDQVERGRLQAREQFMRIVNASRVNEWPGFGDEVQPLSLPTWTRR
jgi:exodeoxyribonuclease VIII